eukprot:TRINITY_DN26032_c0_g1_i1.p1 TRINITY_DN26032_c0_g1~~TRINITY_DN26032_c0_g1_i1.p1  ORF type:complete len:581 (-),score=136.81 TRINITY_DN26032_c0_g1_i1:82-1764(-)
MASADGRADADVLAQLIAPADPDEFFATTWQKRPRVFSGAAWAAAASSAGGGSATSGGSSGSDCGARAARPLAEQTWADCCDLLGLAWGVHRSVLPPDGCDLLFFKGKQLTHDYDYCGPPEALLDGASCVVNHAEYIYPPFAELCLRLRDRLLHVYINSYVTPPASQAVPPHADDRDVFVLQLCGSKSWRVYGNPPVAFPYSDEQVGKNGLSIPEELLRSDPIIDCVLQPGDVLYMPRGFVHEARCPGAESSWHATLAVATHDWSWSKICAATISNALDNEAAGRWRAAVPLGLVKPGAGSTSDEAASAELVEELLGEMRAALSAPGALGRTAAARLVPHNRTQQESIAQFANALSRLEQMERFDPSLRSELWLGRRVSLSSRIRAAADRDVDGHVPLWALREGAAASRQSANGYGGKGGKCCGGKGKEPPGLGKGAKSGQVIVRSALAAAVRDVLAEAERRGDEGLLVSSLGDVVRRQGDRELFDGLSQLCLARACVASGALEVVEDDCSPAAERISSDGGAPAGAPATVVARASDACRAYLTRWFAPRAGEPTASEKL